MKRFLIAILLILLSFDAQAVFVKGYFRKDGTYVSPHYRSSPGTKSGYYKGYYVPTYNIASAQPYQNNQPTVAHEPIKATPSEHQSINKKWLEYYKSAAMITGDTSNLGKVEYICKFQNTIAFWEAIENEYSFCHDRGCFTNYLTKNYHWSEINKKINNIYNYLKSAEQ